MIYGVVGTLDRDTMMKFGLFNIKTGRFQRPASKKGNGKTMVLVYYGYVEHIDQARKVYSNFHTKYSIYKPAQEIFDDLGRILDLAGKYGAYGTITDIIKNFDHIFAHYPLTQIEQTELYELRSLYHDYYGSLILLTEFQKFFNSLGTSTKTIKWIEGILTQLRKLEIDLMWDSQRPISAGNRSREYTETYLVPQKFHIDDETPCDMDICDREHIVKVFSDVPFRENALVTLVCSEVGKLYETNEVIGDVLCSPVEKTNEEKEKARKRSSKRKQQEDPVEQEPEIPKDPAPDPIIISGEPMELEEPVISPPPNGSYAFGVKLAERIPKEADHDISMLLDNAPQITDTDIEELELQMIAESPDVPDIVKQCLPQFKHAGKVHKLFLKYFTEDGVPILPYALDNLHDEVIYVINQNKVNGAKT